MYIMATYNVNIWSTIFIFLDSKINVDGDYSHDIKICLLLGRIAMSKVDSVLQNKDITLYGQRSVKSKLWFFR